MSQPARPPTSIEVVLFVPNAHCPSCTTHILGLLGGLPLPLSQPSVSFLTKRLSFNLPAEDVDIGSATRLVEATLADGGFEVVRPSAVFVGDDETGAGPYFLPGSSGPASTSTIAIGWGGLMSRGVLGRVFGARQARRRAEVGRRLADDRRRQHLAHCLDCQRSAFADDAAPAAASTAHEEGEAFELAVSRPREAQLVETTLSIDGMFCAACTKTLTGLLVAHPAITSAEVVLLSNAAVVTHDAAGVSASNLVELVEDAGYGAEVVNSRPVNFPPVASRSTVPIDEADSRSTNRSTWEVKGMTCASCSGSITKALGKLPGVLSSSVSALQGSAVVEHLASVAPESITEAIEDAGFDAELVETVVVDVAVADSAAGFGSAATASSSTSGPREVRVRLDGMFCPACVRKVDAHLAALVRAGQIRSATALTLQSPLTTVVYDPTPSFTLRELLAGLAALDPAFRAEPYAPPSLSARARAIQAREARQLLGHFALAALATVPTFIIAIVGMVLLPRDAPFRRFWDRPVWGGASLGTVVLWVLATIVQFGVGRIFYKRAFRPILAYFRRRSSAARATSWSWRSLFSFGSMDLLVVLSTTTAYFASLAMLAVDVRSPRMAMDKEKTMTLFDASVFLIFFIVLGRALEGWAKSKTGDAIALLGSLKPDTALLVAPTSDLDNDNSTGAPDSLGLKPTVSTSSAGTLIAKANTLLYSVEVAAMPAAPSASSSATEVAVSHLELGDLVLVRPGALPPSDGTIVRGQSAFDESSLTGESRPVAKRIGDVVLTGTINVGREAVVVRVDSLGEDTMLSRIGKAVEGAMSGKSRIEELAERITGVFVPCIVYFALIVLAIWLGLTLSGRIPDDWIKAHAIPTNGDKVFWAFEFCIAVLVVACPCGIGLAAPTATAVGLGLAAQAGVLAQGGGSAFQAATKVDTVVFDKTGTLTTGKPAVTDYDYGSSEVLRGLCNRADPKASGDRHFLLSALRELESQSSHPLASALQAFADEQLALLPASASLSAAISTGASEEIVGRGLKAVVTAESGMAGQPPLRFEVCVGNEALMTTVGAVLPAGPLIQRWKEGAKSVVLLAAKRLTVSGDGDQVGTYQVCASFAVADPLRPEAEETIAKLRKAGKEVWLCSGDNAVTARAVARQVGIPDDCVVAGVLPEGKAHHINKLKSLPAVGKSSTNGRCIMMAGDGLNDAVALAAADVGVAMGSGSQVSVVSADFVLLNSSLDSLLKLLDISQRVLNRTKLNFCWALVFNLVCLPLAGGVFMAAGRTKLAPVWSALAMALSSVSVVMSSLALKWGI